MSERQTYKQTNRQTERRARQREKERDMTDKHHRQIDKQGHAETKRTRHIVTGIVALLILQLVAQRRENAT